MTIENPIAFCRGLWNWQFLNVCFPRGIRVSDIDGWVECGGYFLILEAKAPGVPLKQGQIRGWEQMIYRWNRLVPGLFTVIVFWGDAPTGRVDRVQFWPSAPFDCDIAGLVEFVTVWAEMAEERAAMRDDGGLVVGGDGQRWTSRLCDETDD